LGLPIIFTKPDLNGIISKLPQVAEKKRAGLLFFFYWLANVKQSYSDFPETNSSNASTAFYRRLISV
jgi:hypothetical protein